MIKKAVSNSFISLEIDASRYHIIRTQADVNINNYVTINIPNLRSHSIELEDTMSMPRRRLSFSLRVARDQVLQICFLLYHHRW